MMKEVGTMPVLALLVTGCAKVEGESSSATESN